MKQLIEIHCLRGLLFVFFSLITLFCTAQSAPFITTWKTDNPGSSCNSCLEIPTIGSGYNYDVDWDNDGVFDEFGLTGNVTHDFGVAGVHTIRIQGDFPRIYFATSGDRTKIINIDQWGTIVWSSMENAFNGCINLADDGLGPPFLFNVTSMRGMFRGAQIFNGDLNNWFVNSVEDMSDMFYAASSFNGELDNWNVGNVTSFHSMFERAVSFNQDISTWDVSSALDMSGMFSQADLFNQDLNNWDVSNVETMGGMFSGAEVFNGNISSWDVSSVENMGSMFSSTDSFNGNIGSWNVSEVENMSSMFSRARAFNSDLENWDTGNVREMRSMFSQARIFNGNVDTWDVSRVENMQEMFFNVPVFNRDLSSWDVSNVETMRDMLDDTRLSPDNYDAILSAWSLLNLEDDVEFGVRGLVYCTGEVGRERLVNVFDWEITGDTNLCPLPDHIPFITTWKTDNSGNSCNSCIEIPAHQLGYRYDVDWDGDGIYDEFDITKSIIHDFGSPGEYSVAIRGHFPNIEWKSFGDDDENKLLSVDQWGEVQWLSLESAFERCENVEILATDSPDLSQVTSLRNMFLHAAKFNNSIDHWDVSNIQDMSGMFWDADSFNQDLNSSDVSNVTDMHYMFLDADNFNQDLNNWNVSNVVEMYFMFKDTKSFNGDISNWNVSNVEEMGQMFQNASVFTGNIGSWDVSNVDAMYGMFEGTQLFNGDISNWDVSNVFWFDNMFNAARAFDQDLGNWDMSRGSRMFNMFDNSAMSRSNYDAILNGWSTQTLKPDVTLGSKFLTYCDGVAGRDILVNTFNWNIEGDTNLCPEDVSEMAIDNCYPGSPVTISPAQGNANEWVSIYDGQGDIICSLYANGNNLGEVSTNVFVSSVSRVANSPYINRDVEINPEFNPSTSVRVRFYYKDSEYLSLESADPGIQDISDLVIAKTSDPCNGVYAGGGFSFIPQATGIFNSSADIYLDIEVSGFSNFHVINSNSGITVPIQLGNLSAELNKEGIKLKWNTFSEINNQGFEIQRLNQFEEWESLDFMNGHGTSTEEINYQYLDRNPLSGINYYRLKQIDYNGAFSYSKVFSEYFETQNSRINLYPNPVSEILTVENNRDEEGSFQIITIEGKVLKTINIAAQSSYELSVGNIPNGTYFLRGTSDTTGTTMVKRFVVLK